MAIAYSTANVSGIADGGSTTRDSSSTVVPSGATAYVLVANSDGSPAAPTGVKFDPTGTNQALTQVGTTISHGTYARASLWVLKNAVAATAVFRATWSSAQGERLLAVYVSTGVDTTTPNGTVTQVQGTTANSVSTGALTTVSGDFLVFMAAYLNTGGQAVAFNSPSGTERAEAQTTGGGAYDGAAVQDVVASGTSTTITWTLSGTHDSWAAFAIPLRAASSNVSVNPSQESLHLTDYAATVTQGVEINAGAESLALTDYAATITGITGQRYSLLFPRNDDLPGGGSDNNGPIVAIKFDRPDTNGLPIWGPGGAGVTVIRRIKPVQQTGYYAQFWYTDDATFEESWGHSHNWGYWGFHPYPADNAGNSLGNSGTQHLWEVATDLGGDFFRNIDNSYPVVVKDRWFTQALKIVRNSANSKTFTFYWDLPNVDNAHVIQFTVTTSNYGEESPPDEHPQLTLGDSPWYADYQHERASCYQAELLIIAKALSQSDILLQAAALDGANTSLVVSDAISNIWYGKKGWATVDDLTCDFGTGRSWTWIDASHKATLGSLPASTAVSVIQESLTLTDYPAPIGVSVSVINPTEALTLTDYPASIGTNAESLVLTDYPASVEASGAIEVISSAEILYLSDYQAQVSYQVPQTGSTGGGAGGRYSGAWTPSQEPVKATQRFARSEIDEELARLLKLAIEREDKAKLAQKIADRAKQSWDSVSSIQRATRELETEIQRLMQTHKISEQAARKKLKSLKDEEDLILALLLMEVA